MADEQNVWRKDGHLAAEGFLYRDAGPHLMLMAFLQRIVNGCGRVEREYGLGRGAFDLLVCWKKEPHAIELKIRRDTNTEAEVLKQITRYPNRLGLSEGSLVMLDLRKNGLAQQSACPGDRPRWQKNAGVLTVHGGGT